MERPKLTPAFFTKKENLLKLFSLDINGANYKVSTFLSSIHLQFQSISTNNVINNKVGRIIIIIYIVYGLSHFTNKQI